MMTNPRHGKTLVSAATLGALLLSAFNIAVSASGTAVALPQIGVDLGAAGPVLSWLFNAYNLAFAICTLVFGSLADLFSRRRMFVVGAVLFGVGCAGSALASHVGLVNAGRAVEGVGAAAMLTSGMAIMSTAFEGAARTRAFAAFATTLGAGIAFGPFLSGRMVGGLGWRVSFLIYAALQIVVLIAAAAIPPSQRGRSSVEWLGIATVAAGVGLVMYGIIQVPDHGWASWRTAALLAAGFVLLALFLHRSAHRADPLLDVALLRNKVFMTWCLATIVTSIGFLPLLSFLPTYFQTANNMTASAAGSTMLLMTAPVLVVPVAGGWLVDRHVTPRQLITLALLLISGGTVWLSALHPGPLGTESLGGMVLIGIGMGLSFAIAAAQALAAVAPCQAGMASGVFNAMRTGAEAIVVAVFGTMLVVLIKADVGSLTLAKEISVGSLGGADFAYRSAELTDAWQMLLRGTALLCAAGAVAVCLLLQPSRSPARAAGRQNPTVTEHH